MSDPVNHPDHYCFGPIECIDYLEGILTPQEFVGYLRGNMIKYQHRLLAKGNPAQDAKKINWYGERLAKKLEELSADPQSKKMSRTSAA
jgi:hypothetical protein